LTKREYFAAQALAGIMASPHIADHAGTPTAEIVSGCARRAVEYADALIKALDAPDAED
jgi:hypothetical protein